MMRFILITDGVQEIINPPQYGKNKDDGFDFPTMAMTTFDKFDESDGELPSLSKIIDSIYQNETITIILLIDIQKNICFVYKYKKTINHVKEFFLPSIDIVFKDLTNQDLVLDQIEDMRDLMRLKSFKNLSMN